MDMDVMHEGRFIAGSSIDPVPVGEGIGRKVLGHDPAVMMTHVTFRKGAVGPVHRHPHRQVSYVETGSFEVSIGDVKRVLRRGDCFFVPPSLEHGVVALEDGAIVDVFAPARMDFLGKDAGR
jgi:quercetin dioxygenase-like cupin family protein